MKRSLIRLSEVRVWLSGIEIPDQTFTRGLIVKNFVTSLENFKIIACALTKCYKKFVIKDVKLDQI